MATTYDEYVPELGAIVTFPVGVSEEAKQRFIQRKLGAAPAPTPPAPPPSNIMGDISRNVKGFVLGGPRGIIEAVAAMPEGIGGITGSELLKSAGAAIRDNPLANLFAGEESAGRTVGELAGNLATFLVPGSAAKLLGAPRLGAGLFSVMGGAAGAAEQVREAERNRAAGMEVTPGQEQLAALAGAATGQLDRFPLGRLSRPFSPALAGAKQLLGEGIGGATARIAGTGVIGGVTEGAQQIAQNLIEQQVYNPQQAALENAVESAGIGAVAEGGLDGLIGFLAKRAAAKGVRTARRIKEEGPAIPRGDAESIGIRRTAEGLPDVTYIPSARPPAAAPTAVAEPASPLDRAAEQLAQQQRILESGAEFPVTNFPTLRPTEPTLPQEMRGLSPEDLALGEDIQQLTRQFEQTGGLSMLSPIAMQEAIQATEARRTPLPRPYEPTIPSGAEILNEILNPAPPYVSPYSTATGPLRITPEGTFAQPSMLFQDLPPERIPRPEAVGKPEGQEYGDTSEAVGGIEDQEYQDAIRLVRERGKASTSLLQRNLQFEYGKAARILDRMYRDGIIGPPNGTKPRDVLNVASPEQRVTPPAPYSPPPLFPGASLESDDALKAMFARKQRSETMDEISRLYGQMASLDQQIEERLAPPVPPPPPATIPRDPMIDQILADQRRQAEQPSAFRAATPEEADQALRQTIRGIQTREARPFVRQQAEATRAARRVARPTIPETPAIDERALDAQQRLAREEFSKNLNELNPDELAIVEAKQQQGLGTAVRPQEVAEVQEFADLPFTRDQYRRAVATAQTSAPLGTRGVATPSSIATAIDAPVETGKAIVDFMVQKGDASPIPRSPNTVRVNPEATGPRYSVEPTPVEPTPVEPTEPPAAPRPLTVATLREEVQAGVKPQVALDLFEELKTLGVDDLLSTRLVDSLGAPGIKGQYADRIVSLALAGRSPEKLRSTLNHEVVHALQELGIFTRAEWNLLQNALSPNAVLSEDERKFYSDAYKNDPVAMNEEAVARGIQLYLEGRMELPKGAANAVEKTAGILDRIRGVFRGEGLDTPENVIAAFKSGEIGGREITGVPTTTAATSPQQAPSDLAKLLEDTDAEGYAVPKEDRAAGARRPGATPEEPTAKLSIEQEPVPNPFFAQPDSAKPIGERAADAIQSLRGTPDQIRMGAIDRRAPIANLARKAGTIGKAEISSEEGVRRADQSIDTSIAGMKYGAVRFDGKPGNGVFYAGDGPHPLGSDGYITEMAKSGKLDKFFHYLAGVRSTGLGEREKFLTPAQIRQYLSYGKDPLIRRAAEQHKQFNDGMIDMVVASGRFSKAEGDRLKQNLYIPYLRLNENAEGEITFTSGSSNLASNPMLKALKGGLGQAKDPLETYIANVNMLTNMAMKNEAMNRIARDGMMTKVMRQATKNDKDVVSVFVNGNKKRLAVDDKLLYESVSYAPQPLGKLVNILAVPGNFLRSSVVISPIYPLRNLIRDSQQVFAQGYTNMPLASAFDGVRKAISNSESFRDLERFGVVSSNIRGEGGAEGTARAARAQLDSSLMNALSRGMRAFEDFNQRFEAANRVVVYENLLKKGRTKAQAASEARELMNFNRHGANVLMRTLSALIPFQNARIQGADVLYRALRKPDTPDLRRQLLMRGTMLAGLSMAYAAAIQQNPAYKNATTEEQENNWFVPLPDGEAIRVPIPFELGFFVKILPENLVKAVNKTQEGPIFWDSFVRFLLSTMKVDFIPQAAKPLAEAVVTNYDSFRGRPVTPDWMKRLEVSDRYDERTSLIAKQISELSGNRLSPIQADHMLRGYSGTTMNYVWQFLDFLQNPSASPSLSGRQAAEVPIVGSLFARKDGGRKLAEAYELRDLADKAAASLRLRLREGTEIAPAERERLTREMGFDRAIEPINQALTALNQRERTLRRDLRLGRITGNQAKPELDDIRARKTQLSERIIEIRRRMIPSQ